MIRDEKWLDDDRETWLIEPNRIMTDTDRARLAGCSPELLKQLGTMTFLVRLKYGNLDADVYAEILRSEAVLAKAEGRDVPCHS